MLAVESMARVAMEVRSAIDANPMQWWFAITDIDLALTAQLIASLSGTMHIGALKTEHRDAWLDHLNNHSTGNPVLRNGKPFKDSIAQLKQLLERAKDTSYSFRTNLGYSFDLSASEEKDILRLHRFRNNLAHVKPTSWSLEVSGLPRMVHAATKAVEQLFETCSEKFHLVKDDVLRMKNSIKEILSFLEV